MNCGTVLYDKHYQFPNGETIDKLVIVVSEFGTDHLVLITTSQPKSKKKEKGCQSKDTPPSYFIPQRTSWFDKDTWIELHYIGELPDAICHQKLRDGTIVEYQNVLAPSLVREILDCALDSDFIDEFYREFLQREREKL
ncbi:MAG: hypothetical protein AABN34_25960 [Acidobacteriota bacterium]